MNKIFIFLIGLSLCFGLGGLQVNAIKLKDTSIEKIYSDLGFKNVSDAVRDTEGYFKKRVDLPIKMPPLIFTHAFGRFANPVGDQNDGLEIVYLNKKNNFNYIINVRTCKIWNKIQSNYT